MVGGGHHRLNRPGFGQPVKILILAAPYYQTVVDALIAGARAEIAAASGTYEIAQVPGALEIAPAIGMAERLVRFDGYVALGCVLRGETSHYDTVCGESARGLTLLGLQGLCIGNGILTVETLTQAEARAAPDGKNKGGAAALAVLHLIALSRQWAGKSEDIGFRSKSGRGSDPVRSA